MMRDPKPPQVLLIGATGQVGRAWQAALPQSQIVGAIGRETLGLSDPHGLEDRLRDLVRQRQPTVIVNAAAYTAVDRAEDEEQLADAVNVAAPGVIAKVAAASNLPLVHYSTDYVFDGHGDRPFAETDTPAPLSVYGRTKLAGERAIQAAGGPHLILRTSWVFSESGQNFLKTMLRLAQTREELRVVDDQVGAPTPASLLVQVPMQMMAQLQSVNDPRWGLYHVCPSGEISWYGYARYVIERARALGWPIRVQARSILAVASTEFPVKATRPKNSRLSTSKLRKAFGITLPTWQQGVDEVMRLLERQA